MDAPGAALIGGGFIGPVHVEALRRIGVRESVFSAPRPDGPRRPRINWRLRESTGISMSFSKTPKSAPFTWPRLTPVTSSRLKPCSNPAVT